MKREQSGVFSQSWARRLAVKVLLKPCSLNPIAFPLHVLAKATDDSLRIEQATVDVEPKVEQISPLARAGKAATVLCEQFLEFECGKFGITRERRVLGRYPPKNYFLAKLRRATGVSPFFRRTARTLAGKLAHDKPRDA